MAEIVEGYEFRKPGGNGKYNWDEWFDGKARRLTHDVDFTCSPRTLSASAYQAARRCGKKLRTTIEDDTHIVIQAYSEE
jgi:hypothetical protein